MVSLTLGGGRETKESDIDLSVGLVLNKKVGDHVSKGDTIATVYASDPAKEKAAIERFAGTYSYSDEKPADRSIIIDTVD